MKTISVIIPVYNVEAYLPRCLDSVLENTYPDLEIICVDDGSTDRCAGILAQYAEKDARIRLIRQENHGVSAARNAGLAAASGEGIAFLDADDWLHPQFFSVMAHWLDVRQADVVICERQRVCSGEAVEPETIGDVDFLDCKWLSGKRMMQDHTAKAYVWGRIFRREILDGMQFPEDIALGEDRAFNLDLVSRHPEMRILRLAQPMYYYFSRQDSAVNTAAPDGWITLASRFLQRCEAASGQEKQLYLTEAWKLAFSARQTCRRNSEAFRKAQIDALLAGCMVQLKKTPAMPFTRKIAYWVIAQFPAVYQLLLTLKTKIDKRRQTR